MRLIWLGLLAAALAVTPALADRPAPRVLMVLTSHGTLGATGKPTGFFLSEVTHPYEVFSAAGFQVDFASPQGGRPPMDGVDRHDPVNAAFLDDPDKMRLVNTTRKLSDVDQRGYDAVFVAGGHGTMYDLPDDRALKKILAGTYGRGGVVSAVCHGPSSLVNVKLSSGKYLVAGQPVAAFTNAEEHAVDKASAMPFMLESKLRERGALVTTAPNFTANVAVGERLVTGQNPASAKGVAEAVVKLVRQRRGG